MTRSSPEDFMARAIELSRRGFPAPNPHVGCVIVKDGAIIGEGFHSHAGGDHAEIAALSTVASAAAGSDVYVTLEPCDHFGRTPPCTQALVQAGVRSVTYAVKDPNPKALGGAETLRRHGIEVKSGLLEDEAAAANEQFLFAFKHHRPLVCIKAAMSLDGRIALPSGESKWITGGDARAAGRLLRAEMGAVLVGSNTVLHDDPLLTVRDEAVVNQPRRIVLDVDLRLTGKERVFTAGEPATHVVSRPVGISPNELVMDVAEGGFRIDELLRALFGLGLTGVLVEGGGRTIASFIRAQLADRLELFCAGKLLGDGPSWVQGLQLKSLDEAPSIRIEGISPVGGQGSQMSDFRVSGRFGWRNRDGDSNVP